MAAPSLTPDSQDRVPMTPGGIALARQRAERGERTIVVDDDGTPLFAVVPMHDMDCLLSDDLKRRLAWERIEQISANFPEDDAAELAMEAALEYRNEMRARERERER